MTKNNLLREPSIFQATNKRFYSRNSGYDAMIFHPRNVYQNGRATFLQTNLKRKLAKIDFKKLGLKSANQVFNENEPILIQAFYTQENSEAIPIDQIILYPNKQISALILPRRDFRIRVMSKDGNIIRQYESKSK